MPGLLSLWHVMQENLRGNNCDTLAEYAVVKKSQSFCTLRRFFCMQRRKTAETDAKRVNLVIMTKLQSAIGSAQAQPPQLRKLRSALLFFLF